MKRYSPETECKKVPTEVCGPGPCPIEKGPENCRQETKTVRKQTKHRLPHAVAILFMSHYTYVYTLRVHTFLWAR